MLTLDLCSGIGGFALGLERAGMRVGAFCEVDPFCRRVLRKHWPATPVYRDVRHVTRRTVRFKPDIITAGFPCQPVSLAGSRKGDEDERWLWPEIGRCIRELRPRWALLENVSGLLSGPEWMGAVVGDLASLGYDAQWHCIPAAAVDAPHQRDRVWIFAHAERGEVWEQPEQERRSGRATKPVHDGAAQDVADAPGHRLQRRHGESIHARGRGQDVADADRERRCGLLDGERQAQWDDADGCGGEAACGAWQTQSPLGRLADGLSDRLARPVAWAPEPDVPRAITHRMAHRADMLRALGNAVVPQVVELVGRAILEADA